MRKTALTRIAAIAALAFSSPALACTSPATYRSVVVNVAPSQVPEGAIVLKVRVESGLYSAELRAIQGLRGEIVSPLGEAVAASKFEIVGRLGSMCNTWIEIWSSDHDAADGVLTGFVVGYPRGVRDGFLVVEPLLFQAAAYRDPDPSRSRGRVTEGDVKRIDPKAAWRPFRVDAATFAMSLEETDAEFEADLTVSDGQ